MKKFCCLLLILNVLIIFSSNVSAKDVYFATAKAVNFERQIVPGDYYYDDESIVGSKYNGYVSAIVKVVEKSNGKLLEKTRLYYSYMNNEWCYSAPHEKVWYYLKSLPSDVAPRILFDYLP